MKVKLSLLLIGLLSIFIRLYRLDLNIPSLYSDEVASGYVFWVFFNDHSLGLIQKAFYFLVYPLYSFTYFLGLTPLGVRLPVALLYSLVLPMGYFLAKKIKVQSLHANNVSLMFALLLVISPWSFMISRIGYVGTLILVMSVMIHSYLYLKANSIKGYIISVIPIIISGYYYSSVVIIAPLLLLLVLKQVLPFLSSKQKVASLLFVVVMGVTIFMALLYLNGGYKLHSRAFDLAIWRDVNVTSENNFLRGVASQSDPSLFSFFLNPSYLGSRFNYNYPISVLQVFWRNYLSFFSPDFLFLKGDPILRHSTGTVGAFFPYLAPFLLYGAFVLFTQKTGKGKELFLFWILVSPIPAAITKDGYGYILRVVTMMPFLTFLIALGVVAAANLFKKYKKIVFISFFILVTLFSFYSFLFTYFHVYQTLSAKSYEYGFKELADFQTQNNNESMLVIWDGYYPHYHFRFWQATPVNTYKSFQPKDLTVDTITVHQAFFNLYFANPSRIDDAIAQLAYEKVAFVAVPASYDLKDSRFKEVEPNKVIYYPDHRPAFYIYEITSSKK